MPPEMTAIPKKLKEGGYATHMVYVCSYPLSAGAGQNTSDPT